MERIRELLLERCRQLEQMRQLLLRIGEAPADERRQIRGTLLRYRRQEQVRQSDENEAILFISKNCKYTVGWQRYSSLERRQFVALLEQVLPQLEARELEELRPQPEGDLAETIVEMLVEHYRQQGELHKVGQLERALMTRTSNYVRVYLRQQVCTLVNALIESTRSEFSKTCRMVLDLLFRLIRPMEAPFQKENKPTLPTKQSIEIQPAPPKNKSVKSQQSILQEFATIFNEELREYYRFRGECIGDIDGKWLRALKEDQYAPNQRKTEWLEQRMEAVVQRLTSNNSQANASIGSFRTKLSARPQPLKLKRRLTTKTTNRSRQKPTFSGANASLLEPSRESLKTMGNLSSMRRTNPTVQNSPETDKFRLSCERSDIAREFASPQRIEYKISKSPLQLNIQMKYNCRTTSYRQSFQRMTVSSRNNNITTSLKRSSDSIFSSNRISGQARNNLSQLPHYIQALKDIINL